MSRWDDGEQQLEIELELNSPSQVYVPYTVFQFSSSIVFSGNEYAFAGTSIPVDGRSFGSGYYLGVETEGQNQSSSFTIIVSDETSNLLKNASVKCWEYHTEPVSTDDVVDEASVKTAANFVQDDELSFVSIGGEDTSSEEQDTPTDDRRILAGDTILLL